MRLLSILLLLGLSACKAHVGAAGVTLPPDSAQQCEAQCRQIGLELSAVAVMANNVGCVCVAKVKASTNPGLGDQAASSSAGMATIMMQETARQQQQQSSARR